MLTERRVGEKGGARLYVSKLEIRVGGALQVYETVQRQGDGSFRDGMRGCAEGCARDRSVL